jgi:hypothetical protein
MLKQLAAVIEKYDQTGQLPVIYIAGPMTGYDDFNFEAFDDAAYKFRLFGFRVLNPADFGSAESTLAEIGGDDAAAAAAHRNAMARDLPLVCAADVLYLLEGWQASRGANLEVHTASLLGKLIIAADEEGLLAEFLTSFFDEDEIRKTAMADGGAEEIRRLLFAGASLKIDVRMTLDQARAFLGLDEEEEEEEEEEE